MDSNVPVAIVMIGPPGSGKGTQSGKLGAFLGIPKISTGDILRQVASGSSRNSQEIRAIMETGGLVPDSILADLVTSRLSEPDCKNGFILDGYPRNIDQVIFLENLLLARKYKLLVVEIAVPEDILLKRVTGRFSCRGCGAIYNKYFLRPQNEKVCDQCGSTDFAYRSDDNELVIRERLREYTLQTLPVLDYYKAKHLLVSVDGNRSLDEVYDELICQLPKAL
ncbi:adenylate kinase [Chloracidobacterium sp. MS 40/45]|jgi:adenylate kinase|uniref:adenylate kinase n=1 Tax=Chloracidobacterium aggregatum TaxID=2851959 RepID=UPI001B8CD182|nr:adenylate kinase [Chloracidobacterium aggregatum]QUV99223.1 adenylate kinase [Chloracidobacterium sp. MS 40/45]